MRIPAWALKQAAQPWPDSDGPAYLECADAKYGTFTFDTRDMAREILRLRARMRFYRRKYGPYDVDVMRDDSGMA